MPDGFEQVVNQFPNAVLSIREYGPPMFQGESPHRVAIDGNPSAFRLLANLLNLMADSVEAKSDSEGWYFVVSKDVVPQLRMDEEHMLILSCDPTTIGDSWDNQNSK